MSAAAKHIFFDWNGTLLDDFHAVHQSINHILQMDGHPQWDVEQFRQRYENTPMELYTNLGLTVPQIENLLRNDSENFHFHYENMAQKAPLREGAVELLDYIGVQKIHASILSNHILDTIIGKLRHFGIERCFANVLAFADRASQFKHITKGERLHNYMAEHGLDKSDVMIVGDSKEEVAIGRKHGVACVAITGGCASEERLRSEKPDYVIHALHELKPILQERGFAA